MTREDILEQVTQILRDEFEDDELEVTEETTAADVEDWDSLAHISLIHEVEQNFDIKFTLGEIQDFQNVGEMIDSIEVHLGQA
ncbi:MAG: acyl carrier protein [Lachnospiraceae bacterium]|nr:acyl carrier protein [Lachnospiraceae bacterium]